MAKSLDDMFIMVGYDKVDIEDAKSIIATFIVASHTNSLIDNPNCCIRFVIVCLIVEI